MIAAHNQRSRVNDWVSFVLPSWLRRRGHSHLEVSIPNNMLLFCFRTCQRCTICRRGILVRNLGWIHSMIILVMISTRICILIEVHQDILNLSLFRRVHYHDNWWRWCTIDILWIRSARCRLMTYEFAACKIVLCISTAIMCIECLWGWASPCLLSALFCRASSLVHKSRGPSSWSLPLWWPLWIANLMNGLLIIVLGEVGVRSVLLVTLVSLITRCWCKYTSLVF